LDVDDDDHNTNAFRGRIVISFRVTFQIVIGLTVPARAWRQKEYW